MAEPVHAGAPLQPVDGNQLPDWMANASTRFGVIGDAWKVTANPAIDRGIRFNPGRGWSDGILTDFDETNVPASFGLPSSATSQYYMIVSRVNWQDPFTRTFVAIPAGTSRALPVTSLEYYRDPGVIADFPVALVLVPGNSTSLGEIVDLRVWRGDSGILIAKSDLVTQYLDRPGTVVQVDTKTWLSRWDSNGFLEWVDWHSTDDTGWIAGERGGPGWSGLSTDYIYSRRLGKMVEVHISITRSGGDITVPNDTGDLANFHIGNTGVAFAPQNSWAALSSGPSGRMCAVYVERGTGKIMMAATTPGAAIKTGQTFSASGTYFID